MRLEVGDINIKDVRFGNKTEFKEGVLFINEDELIELVSSDRRLTRVSIELAHPGEKVRIFRVCDIIEPRTRTGARKGQFPFPCADGIRGTAGEGSVNALRGVCVTLCDQGGPFMGSYDMGNPAESNPVGVIVDMSGKAAEVSHFGKLNHVCIIAYPPGGFDAGSEEKEQVGIAEDYAVALKLAGLRAAAYLGKAAEDLKPKKVEVFELPPVPEIPKGMENLPRLGYIFQIHWGQWYAITGEPVWYGDDCKRLQPTIIHPNEVLDGAAVRSYFGMGTNTYIFQNHPIITELYRRHGKDLCFMGVILDMSICFEPERERAVNAAAKLAKNILGLDGVILNKFGGGAPMVDTSQCALACERKGIKSVTIMGDVTYPDGGSGCLFNQPECSAIVNTGSIIVLHPPSPQEKAIGRPEEMEPRSLGKMKGSPFKVMGGADQLGFSKIRAFHNPFRQEVVDKNGAERAVDMAIARITGKPWEPEIPLPTFEHPEPAKAVRNISKAKIALISSGCCIPKGNPDELRPSSAEKFGSYDIKGIRRLSGDIFKSYHIGLRLHYINEDPNRLVPVDAMRELEREGVIGKLSDKYYTWAGVATSVEATRKFIQPIIREMKSDGVDAVILTAT